jgi:hypothetical protein
MRGIHAGGVKFLRILINKKGAALNLLDLFEELVPAWAMLVRRVPTRYLTFKKGIP